MLRGGCQCGFVRYAAGQAPLEVYICHCTECRKQSASAFGISCVVPRKAFELRAGSAQRWCRTTQSGHLLECFFCPQCGSRLWHQSSGNTETLNIKGGTLDEPLDLSAAVHIWTAGKLPGISIPTDAKSFPREPI